MGEPYMAFLAPLSWMKPLLEEEEEEEEEEDS